MAHSGKTITFATDLLPNEDGVYKLGDTNQKWKINGADEPLLTDQKQNTTLATTSKAYITGVTTTPTATAAALEAVADTGVYLTTTVGELSAVQHSWNVGGTEKAYTIYDSSTDCINFIFV